MKLFGVGQEEKVEEILDEYEETPEFEEEIGQLALDILETPNQVIILSPIAGVDLNEIDVSFNKWVLVIKGNRVRPEIFDENVDIRNSECFWWPFSRNIILPENLNTDSIDASMEHNLLVITIQKLQFETTGNIKINRTTY